MFHDNIKTEPIPERILELARIVKAKNSISKADLRKIYIQDKLSSGTTDYFNPVLGAAEEIELLKEDADTVTFIGDPESIKTTDSFRRYCNSRLFLDKESHFYIIIACFLSANDEWFKYGSITGSNEIQNILNEATGISTIKLKKDVVLGIRFWLSFLGFGFIQESVKIFLPNMYKALKDFVILGDLEKGKDYSVSEFFDHLCPGIAVAVDDSKNSRMLNLALSNALRLMNDKQEIKLSHNLDSAEVWYLFKNEEHIFTSEITHITYLGVK